MSKYEKIVSTSVSLPAESNRPTVNILTTECGCKFAVKNMENINFCPKCRKRLKFNKELSDEHK